jgi:uncharacterized protein (TIGR00299 family) protein
MSEQRFAIIDPVAGASGDMLLGALIDLGAPAEWLRGLPARLGLADVEIEIASVLRSGIGATKVTVKLGGAIEGPGDVSLPEHEHHHGEGDHEHHRHHGHGEVHHQHDHDGHPHRHVGELLAMIARAPLTPWVKQRATAAFRLLAEAEGRVHRVDPDRVALHEVGALDALVDIVGAVEGFEQLGVREIYRRPVVLGSGWVRAAHGTLPVPTPATAILAEGLEVASAGPVVGEATTPTGAALLRALTGGPVSGEWRAVATGWGAGTRDPAGYPNALRVVLAEPVGPGGDEVLVVATDVDDLSPEYLEPLREALVEAGALDVQSWPTQAKKGRTGFRVEALVPPGRLADVAGAFFRHSGTAGVRYWRAERDTLPREQWELLAEDGARVRIKTLHGPDGARVKPEFDDVMAAARSSGQPAYELSRRYRDEALRRIGTGRGEDQHEHEKES